MAAITCTLLSLLSTGQHLIITDDSYRRTRQFCTTFLKRFGVECTIVPAGDSVLRLLPPLIVTEAEIDEATNRLERALEAVAARMQRAAK